MEQMLIKKLDAINGETFIESMIAFQSKLAFESEELTLDSKVLEQGIREVLSNSSLGVYYICVDSEHNLMGMLLTIKEWSDWRCKHVLWIHSVYIDKEKRMKGVFKALYHHIKQIVEQENDLAGIRLYVDKSNMEAIKVYEKLGMSDEHYKLFEWLKD